MAHKSWKLIFWFFGMVALLAGIAIIYIQTADWNRYKSVITEIVERQSGLRLYILGDISLTLFPRPALSVARIQLSKAAQTKPENISPVSKGLYRDPQPFDDNIFGIDDVKRPPEPVKSIISAERLDIVIALGALFQGKISPRDLRLIELEATLFMDQKGAIALYADTGSSDDAAGIFSAPVNRGKASGRKALTRVQPKTDDNTSNESALKSFDGLETLSILNSRVIVHQKTTEALVKKREVRIVEITMQGNIMARQSDISAKLTVDGVAVELDLALEKNLQTETQTVTGTGIINQGIIDFSGRLGRESFASRIEISAPDGLGFLNGLASIAGQDKIFSTMTGIPLGVDFSVAGQDGGYDITARLLKLGTSQGSFTGQIQRLQPSLEDQSPRGVEGIFQSLGDISQPVFTIDGALDIAVLKIEDLQDILAFKKGNSLKSFPASVDRKAFGQKFFFSNYIPLRGDIHFSIGAVPLKQGAFQQISGRVAISDQAVDLKDVVGLMPGATSFALSGRQLFNSESDLTGTLSVTSGSLRDALAWLDVDGAQMGSLDRLSTATIRANFTLGRDYFWQLRDIRALIDSSNISGEIKGRFDRMWPSYIDIEVDFVPMQAWFGPYDSPHRQRCFLPDCFLPENLTDVNWSLAITTIPFGALEVKNIKLNLSGSAKMIAITNSKFSVADHQGSLGTVIVNGAVSRLLEGGWSSDLVININDVEVDPITLLAFGDYHPIAKFTKTGKHTKTGQIQIKGPGQALNIIAGFRGIDQSFQLTGQAALEREKFRLISAQGTFSHLDINPLLRSAGTSGTRPIEADATFSLTSQDGVQLLTSGRVGGSRFIATFKAPISPDSMMLEKFLKDKNSLPEISVELSLDAPKALELEHDFGVSSGFLVPDQSFALATHFKLAGQKGSAKNRVNFTKLILTQPGKRIEGNLILSNEGLSPKVTLLPENTGSQNTGSQNTGPIIEGEMTIEGFTYPLQALPVSSLVALDSPFAAYDHYSGDVNLNIVETEIYGQSFTVSGSRLSFNRGRYQFSSGKKALLNGRPLSISLGFSPLISKAIDGQNNNMAKAVQVQIKSDGFDPTSFLQSLGYKTPFTSQLELDVALSAILENNQKMINTVSGAGTVKISGGALTFLDAQGVSGLIEQGDNLSVILARLPSLLKTGQSSLVRGDIVFRAEEGIMLLDRFNMEGRWGGLSLDGQINLRDERLRLSGDLTLSKPFDIPGVPVRYEGALSNPSIYLGTDKLLSFAQTLLTGRIRNRLAQEAKRNTKLPAGVILDNALEILTKKVKIKPSISSPDKPARHP